MIVRCTNCNSAFAVDDAKVENKKFAFKCPKCSAENIIDNLSASHPVDTALGSGETGDTASGSGFDGASSVDTSHEQAEGDRPAAIGVAESEEEHLSEGGDSGFNIALSEDSESVDAESAKDIITDDLDSETDSVIRDETEPVGESEISPDAEAMNIEEIAGTEEKTDIEVTSEVPVEESETEADEKTDAGFEVLEEDASLTEGLDVEPVEAVSGREEISLEDDFTDEEDEDERITIDLESLDIELEEGEGDDDDITLDLESLDIELAEEKEVITAEKAKEDELPDTPEIESAPEMDLRSARLSVSSEDNSAEDESITLDLDSLDLDLVEDDTINEGEIPDDSSTGFDAELEPDKPAVKVAEEPDFGEEDITLDLDSLDIDLEEDPVLKTGETPEEMIAGEPETAAETAEISEQEPAEEDITLDLESLDIDLEETEEIKEGEVLEEDEKLTLEDAGLTFDELTSEEAASVIYDTDGLEDEDDDIRITIDEIDPTLDIDNLGEGLEETEKAPDQDFIPMEIDEDLDSAIEKELEEIKLETDSGDEELPELDPDEDELKLSEIALDSENDLDDIEKDLVDSDLPEIDLSEFDEEIESEKIDDDSAGSEPAAVPSAGITKAVDDMIHIEDDGGYSEDEVSDYKFLPVSKGSVNFSIDYSLAYSRLGAFLRLIFLFLIALIPHFVVFLVYSVLSLILGLLNHIVIMATGNPVEDFHTIQENTLRYFLSISASLLGIVEEMPNFAGRDDIDYSLQLNVKYPVRYSNLLAALRLSVVGILLVTLPHLIVLALLSLVIPFAYIAGIISVLISGRWPHFLFEFLTMYYRSVAKVGAFIIGLIDNYPPFRFS